MIIPRVLFSNNFGTYLRFYESEECKKSIFFVTVADNVVLPCLFDIRSEYCCCYLISSLTWDDFAFEEARVTVNYVE